MHPVFVARGPAFKQDYLINTTVNSVDIYLLMCTILDLTPAEHNGTFNNISDFLKDNS